MEYILDFEKPILELEEQIEHLKNAGANLDVNGEVLALEKKAQKLRQDIYEDLNPWQLVQLARHPKRPHGIDFIKNIFNDFHEVHGDRKFADDRSLIAGFAYLNEEKVAVLAIEKGRKTAEKIQHNFGMMNPEGYRKAIRVMKLAEKFKIPIVTFIDTPGAYPGIGAEERGQAEAIADSLVEMAGLKTPIISIVIGEGGSGGALGLGIADKVYMFQYSVYSVISPESCASILWADPRKAEDAAKSLQLTAKKSLELGIIDEIIPEPLGGNHLAPEVCFKSVCDILKTELVLLGKVSCENLLEKRFQKFRQMGNQTLIKGE